MTAVFLGISVILMLYVATRRNSYMIAWFLLREGSVTCGITHVSLWTLVMALLAMTLSVNIGTTGAVCASVTSLALLVRFAAAKLSTAERAYEDQQDLD